MSLYLKALDYGSIDSGDNNSINNRMDDDDSRSNDDNGINDEIKVKGGIVTFIKTLT